MQYANLRSVLQCAIVASLIALGLQITRTDQTGAINSTTINANVCTGGINSPSGSIAQPVNNATVAQQNTDLTINTNWVTNIKVYRGATLLAEKQSIPYMASNQSVIQVPLVEGANDLHLVLFGGCPESSVQTSVSTIFYSPTSATVNPLVTNRKSPRLTGRVHNTMAFIRVALNGKTYDATNNGDGTWTLPAGVITPDLVDNTYDVQVIATLDGAVVSDIVYAKALTVDTVKPNGTASTTNTDSRSPSMSGTIDDPQATVTISINGQTYPAVNNGDGTWTLPAGVIDDLASGTYLVTVTFTDKAGNTSTYQYTLTVNAPNELGFILAPNTGYMRIGNFNISSWFLYILAGILVAFGGWRMVKRAKDQ